MISQSSISEFRSAYDIGKSRHAEAMVSNPVLETIQVFAKDKRVLHFEEDLPVVIRETISGTLTDANHLREAAKELELIIASFSKMKTALIKQADEIIEQRHGQGITQEGNFEIFPIVGKAPNRKVNREVLLSDKFKKRYEDLLDNAIEDLKEGFTPTVKAVEATFGKKADEILISGTAPIVGYDIRLISSMPEQASAAVEL